jgi:hypothetical protein
MFSPASVCEFVATTKGWLLWAVSACWFDAAPSVLQYRKYLLEPQGRRA